MIYCRNVQLCTGTPTLEEYAAITSRRSRDYIRALPIRKRKAFGTLIPTASPSALDFLSRTLVLHYNFDMPPSSDACLRRHLILKNA